MKGAPVESFLNAGQTFNGLIEKSSSLSTTIFFQNLLTSMLTKMWELDGDKLDYPANDAERKRPLEEKA